MSLQRRERFWPFETYSVECKRGIPGDFILPSRSGRVPIRNRQYYILKSMDEASSTDNHRGSVTVAVPCIERRGLPIILLGSYLPGKPRNVLF